MKFFTALIAAAAAVRTSSSPQSLQLPKYYAEVCLDKTLSYQCTLDDQFQFGNASNYQILKNETGMDLEIGRGSQGVVYKAVDVRDGKSTVIKEYMPFDQTEVNIKNMFDNMHNEIKINQVLSGSPNIIRLLDTIHDRHQPEKASAVFEFFKGKKLPLDDDPHLNCNLTTNEVRNYMYKLLQTLDSAHSKGIMHLDAYKHNILIDPENHEIRLIDWGASKFYLPGQKYHIWHSPEALIEYDQVDYSYDIFYLGRTFSVMLLNKIVIDFKEENVWASMSTLFGSKTLIDYNEKYGSHNEKLAELVGDRPKPKNPWQQFIDQSNVDLISDDSLDLLGRMLVVDHAERITAKDALEHPYFDAIKSDSVKK